MNMLRKFILPGLLAIACTAVGQNYNAEKVDRPNTKKINIGIKAGFNSSMFMVSELKIKDVTIDEVQNNYKICLLYTSCVVFIDLCPNDSLIISIGTPRYLAVVAQE